MLLLQRARRGRSVSSAVAVREGKARHRCALEPHPSAQHFRHARWLLAGAGRVGCYLLCADRSRVNVVAAPGQHTLCCRRLSGQLASTAALKKRSVGTLQSLKGGLQTGKASASDIAAALHTPWAKYATALLANAQPHDVAKRLPDLELVGARVAVDASLEPSNAGISGVVAWATPALLHVLTDDGRLRSVCRQGACVLVDMPAAVTKTLGTPHRLYGARCPVRAAAGQRSAR